MKKLLGPLLTAFAFILIAYSFVTAVDRIVWMHGLAHAQGAGSGDVPPQMTIAIQSIDQGWGLVSAYGWIWGGGLLVYVLAAEALRKNDSEHWLAQGRTLAIIVAVVGVLGSCLMAHFAGAPNAGIFITALVGVAKIILPIVKPKAAS